MHHDNMIPINSSVVTAVTLSRIDGHLKMLLLKRAREGYWCQVGGKLKHGENAIAAIIREMSEETGIAVNTVYSADYLEQFYSVESHELMIIPSFVVWCPPDQRVRLNHEHTDYIWCNLEEAVSLAPFVNQHQLYQHVWKMFVEQKPNPLLLIKNS